MPTFVAAHAYRPLQVDEQIRKALSGVGPEPVVGSGAHQMPPAPKTYEELLAGFKQMGIPLSEEELARLKAEVYIRTHLGTIHCL